jgi:glutamate synthase domain-containing protein 2
MRKSFLISGLFIVLLFAALSWQLPSARFLFAVSVVIYALGLYDILQRRHTILRNFPVLGHFRFLLELIRPEIQQYFIEGYADGKPFSREQRAVVYQRSKLSVDTVAFGTQLDVYKVGSEWIDHSLQPAAKMTHEPRVVIGNEQCSKPYSASLFNISAMSFGSLSKNAILALNKGAQLGGFIQDTGEGGLTEYHLRNGGDITWEIGSGYFGCRTLDGKFSEEKFTEKAVLPNVKMIEVKLSQGAKPGHGGILPAAKVSQEIANIRGVKMGEDCVSPAMHTAFDSPLSLMQFIATLRRLSGGKPVGFKLCVGKKREFFAICKAMLQTGITPDFITVDGSEGGTGAAPLEFANWVGTPLNEGLTFVHNTLVGIGLRDKVRIIASGKVITGFDIAAKIALGADLCNTGRGMMFAVGCIQALRCNTNRCPTGVATQDLSLMKGLDVQDKSTRVFNYHRLTIDSFLEVLAAVGLTSPQELRPWHILRRINDTQIRHYNEIYEYIEPGALLRPDPPAWYHQHWLSASPESFHHSAATV